jgi:hypothetical protein
MQMIKKFPLNINVKEITKEQLIDDLKYGFYSAIGHEPTASLLTNKLGLFVQFNRIRVTVQAGDIIYICQYMGGRLPEGATELPPDGEIKYLKVEFFD